MSDQNKPPSAGAMRAAEWLCRSGDVSMTARAQIIDERMGMRRVLALVEAAKAVLAVAAADIDTFQSDDSANLGYSCGIDAAADKLRPALSALEAAGDI